MPPHSGRSVPLVGAGPRPKQPDGERFPQGPARIRRGRSGIGVPVAPASLGRLPGKPRLGKVGFGPRRSGHPLAHTTGLDILSQLAKYLCDMTQSWSLPRRQAQGHRPGQTDGHHRHVPAFRASQQGFLRHANEVPARKPHFSRRFPPCPAARSTARNHTTAVRGRFRSEPPRL